ncbi:MAG: DUF2336 domain-containing protein, partial [Rhodospirillales bacterium]|nr:DUF2336 domain-containing protein [Rhodospirillales bacterium]
MTKIEIIDDQHLLKLAAQHSVEGRSELAGTISNLFDESAGSLSDRERILMFDILRSIIHDVEMSVRRKLSEMLAGFPDAPQDLIRTLANDEIEIAYPILNKSVVLRDADLIEVIRNRTLEHQLAIATRESVSEEVSDALVSTGDKGVIKELLSNPKSRISNATMEYLAEESRRVDTFQEPVVHHTDLAPELAQRMFIWVSASLRDHILTRFNFDATTIDVLLLDAATAEMELVEAHAKEKSKSSLLAQELKNEGLLN